MNVIKLVVRFVFVLFLAACGGGSTTDEIVSVASSEQRMKALAATDPSSLNQTSTGFFYPIGKAQFEQECGTWLGRDRSNGGCYFDGKYHNGIDMMHDGKVFAIADGRIYKRHCHNLSWGPGNCAIFVEHKTADGLVFTALYGHVTKESTKDSGQVVAGDVIGVIGPWDNGKHLHFGIFRGTQVPGTVDEVRGWGRMANSEWRDPCDWNDTCTNSFENPVAFIRAHYAYNPSTEEQVYCQGNGCWKPGDGSCENASKWYRIPNQSFVQQNQSFVQPTGREICSEVAAVVQSIVQAPNPQKRTPNEHGWQSWLRKALQFFGLGPTASAAELQQLNDFHTLNTVYVLEGRIVSGSASKLVYGTGQGYEVAVTDPPTPNPPDFVTKRSWLETPWGFETYQYGQAETLKMKGQFKNDGDGPCIPGEKEAIIVHAYLSNGYKEDAHSDWKLVGTDEIQCANLKPGDTHTETEGLVLSDLTLGIHNIVWCIDHPKTDHNEGGDHKEKHESNNCSTEAVFEIVPGVVNVPTVDFIVHGLTVLQAPTYAGDFARFGGYIQNRGTARPGADIRSSYTISCNGGLTLFLTDDETKTDQLTAGESAWEETITAVRMPDTPGTCTVTMTADYQGVVGESDETNNSQSLTLTLTPRPLPDLIITYIGMGDYNDTSIRKGNTKYPTLRIKNQGPGSVGALTRQRYYLYGPATGNVWREIDGDDTEASLLCTGCETTEKILKGYAINKTGIHYLKACADPDNRQPETDEGNNCKVSDPITVK